MTSSVLVAMKTVVKVSSLTDWGITFFLPKMSHYIIEKNLDKKPHPIISCTQTFGVNFFTLFTCLKLHPDTQHIYDDLNTLSKYIGILVSRQ